MPSACSSVSNGARATRIARCCSLRICSRSCGSAGGAIVRRCSCWKASVVGSRWRRRPSSAPSALACKTAGITKPVTPRSLRHAFATHLLESGANLRVVQTLLGHQSLNTTAVYTHLAKSWLADLKSPLDRLKEPPTTA